MRRSPASRTEKRVTPGEIMSDPKSENPGKTMEALLKMAEIDIKTLQRAHAGRK